MNLADDLLVAASQQECDDAPSRCHVSKRSEDTRLAPVFDVQGEDPNLFAGLPLFELA